MAGAGLEDDAGHTALLHPSLLHTGHQEHHLQVTVTLHTIPWVYILTKAQAGGEGGLFDGRQNKALFG